MNNLTQLKLVGAQWQDNGVPVALAESPEVIVPYIFGKMRKADLRNDGLAGNAYGNHLMRGKTKEGCIAMRKRMSSEESYLEMMSELVGFKINSGAELDDSKYHG